MSKNDARRAGAKHSSPQPASENQGDALAAARRNVAALGRQHQQALAQATQLRDTLLKWQGVMEYLESIERTQAQAAPAADTAPEGEAEPIPS